ncbi:MAG: cell division ATPase MinD [Candidatus Altiarchaeota archaeon]|nr:cell division ATPase MinD [Candidatus Altiarchaeota archaeon]
MTRIIGVVSGKGGVGKTTLVSNLGASLAKEGYNVAIIDANLTGANLGLHYGLISYPISVHDVMKKNASLTDAVYKHPSGVDIIPASLSFEDILDTPPVNIGQEIRSSLADKDYVLIDAATGLDRETLNAVDICDEFVLVTHPELPTISDALRTKSIISKYEKKITGIVLNRVTKKDELKKDYIASFFKLPILGVIPEDSSIRRSIELKNPIVLHSPKHKISREIKRIAHGITGKEIKAKNSVLMNAWESIVHTLLGKKPKKG